jgi:hypothetical protein
MAREPTPTTRQPAGPAVETEAKPAKATDTEPAKAESELPANPSLHRGKAAAPTPVYSKPYGSEPASIDPKTGLKLKPPEKKEAKPAA